LQVLRKERAVGVLPLVPTIYEVLEELTLTVQQQLAADIPFCAFNGGNDVFVDVGNKSLGLEALMQYLNCEPVRLFSFHLSALRLGDAVKQKAQAWW
jgi:IMP and pyridine-specific 5'-nucleotidase